MLLVHSLLMLAETSFENAACHSESSLSVRSVDPRTRILCVVASLRYMPLMLLPRRFGLPIPRFISGSTRHLLLCLVPHNHVIRFQGSFSAFNHSVQCTFHHTLLLATVQTHSVSLHIPLHSSLFCFACSRHVHRQDSLCHAQLHIITFTVVSASKKKRSGISSSTCERPWHFIARILESKPEICIRCYPCARPEKIWTVRDVWRPPAICVVLYQQMCES